jgi:hypothetical protein
MNKVFTVRKKRGGEIRVIYKKAMFLPKRSWFSHKTL